MLKKTLLILWSSCLTACVTDNPPYTNEIYNDAPMAPYIIGYENTVYTTEDSQPMNPKPRPVPTQRISHKEMDSDWVKNQNPSNYTIEVADDEKPAPVASKLSKTPKQERSAEIKTVHEGKTSYKGLYGTYSNQQEAERALNALPPDVKQGANLRTFGSVQSDVNE